VVRGDHVERFPDDAILPPDSRPSGGRDRELGDFTTTRTVLGLAALALLIGAAVAVLVGLSQFDLLRAYERVLVEERYRERPLGPRGLAPGLGALLPSREPTL
jgi:hypothetical protein